MRVLVSELFSELCQEALYVTNGSYVSRPTLSYPPLILIGCVDEEGDSDGMAPSAEVESVKKATVTHCTPKSGYDTCYEIDNQDLEYWQTTLPDPDWRTIEPSSEPGIDVEVTVETEDLNAGVIPTASGQGHYNDWDDYQSALDSLLGVDTDQYDVALRVKGPTLKLDDSQEPTAATTGVFRFDALSNEDGEIYIDGQDKTSVLMEDGFGNDHKITYDDGSGSSTVNAGDPNNDGGAST